MRRPSNCVFPITSGVAFIRLVGMLGSTYKAAGALEMLRMFTTISGDPRLGSSLDVEDIVGWDGEKGECTEALHLAGVICSDEDVPGLIEGEYELYTSFWDEEV